MVLPILPLILKSWLLIPEFGSAVHQSTRVACKYGICYIKAHSVASSAMATPWLPITVAVVTEVLLLRTMRSLRPLITMFFSAIYVHNVCIHTDRAFTT